MHSVKQKASIVNHFLLLVALIVASCQAQEEMLLVVSVSRHGARTPNVIMPFNASGSEQFKNTSNLLAHGFFQHSEIGKRARQRYINEFKFLSTNYDSSQIFGIATDKERTQLSLLGQFYGLYPNNTSPVKDWVSAGNNNTGYKFTNLTAAENLITRLSDSSCPLFKAVQNVVLASAPYTETKSGYYKQYKSDLEKMINWNNITQLNFEDACWYMYYAKDNSDLSLNFTTTPLSKSYCGAIVNMAMYELCRGLDIQWQLVSYEYLSQLLEFTQYLNGSKTTVDQLPTFWKYYKKNNQNNNKTLPKYMIYTSHQEVLLPLFKGLGWDVLKEPLVASALYVEFYKDYSTVIPQTKVRVFFNDTPTAEGIKVPVNGKIESFSLQDFGTFLEKQLSSFQFKNSVADVCTNTAFNYGGSFYPAEEWKSKMVDLYPGLGSSSKYLAISLFAGLSALFSILY
ncbi:hypothetical protein FGO68_gene870 [Halteria grandinella]|uniref:Uncharacterized protein n=1 Tax=Halteria grandinella TaxID=5974 RepID=A0A8J8NRW8_HALGN|nr:hypothetical protein FGO68_gene870 [Halteria grandinella]